MQLLAFVPLFLTTLTPLVRATAYPDEAERCFFACQETYVSLGITFTGAPKAAASQKCLNDLFVRSVYLCGREYCSEDEISAGSKFVDTACAGPSYYNGTTRQMVEAVPASKLSMMRRFNFEDKLKNINTTIVPSANLFQLSVRSTNAYYDGKNRHTEYAWGLEIFWAGILCIGTVYHLATLLHESMLVRRPTSTPTKPSSLWTQIRTHLLLPATFKHICATASPVGTLPPRLETAILVTSFTLNIILCAVGHDIFPHNLYWDDETLQRWRYLTDRLGQLALANLVVAWLFAIRNNPFRWLTGWEYATFSRLHRWQARIFAAEALVHVLGRTVYNVQFSGVDAYRADFLQQNWIAGTVATAGICLTMAVTTRVVRVKVYDVFSAAHNLLAVLILVALFFHVKKFNGQFDPWLWTCVALWVFDRVCRVFRILSLVVSGKGIYATADLDDEANLIRIDISAAHFPYRMMQQGYLFLYSPFTLTFWQNHPFTLVRWKPQQGSESPSSSPSASNPDTTIQEKGIATATTVPSPDTAFEEKGIARASTVAVQDDASYQYSLLMVPNKGYTARLRKSLLNSVGPQNMHFMFEGPYSSLPDLRRYSDIVMFVSGSGISVAISSVYEILETNPGARVHIVWATRRWAMVRSVAERELAYALGRDNVKLDVYITTSDVAKNVSGNLSTMFCRPDIPVLLGHAVAECPGALAVVVCGSASFTDDARKAFCEELGARKREMSLFVQSFNW